MAGIVDIIAGRQGAWFKPQPIGNFLQSIAPDVPATADGQYFRRWLDSSANANHVTSTDMSSLGYVDGIAPTGGLPFSVFTSAGGGGATTGFYFCVSVNQTNYYGMVFTDVNTANTGFSVEHDSDNQGFVFSIGTGAARTSMVLVTDPTIYNVGGMGLGCVECWYDGTTMYARKDKGPVTSQPCGAAAAGTAGFRLFAVADNVNAVNGTFHQVTYIKNYVPTLAERNTIADESILASSTVVSYNVPITGLAATAAPGAVLASVSYNVPLTGRAATTARGSVSKVVGRALTGRAATTARGTLSKAVNLAITGLPAAVSPGAVSTISDYSVVLTGLPATASIGAVSTSSSYDVALTGLPATVSPGAVSTSVSYAVLLTGLAASTASGAVSTGSSYSAALVGMVATASPGAVSTGAGRSVALVGVAATASPGIVSTGSSYSVALAGRALAATLGVVSNTVTKTASGAALLVSGGVVGSSASKQVALTGRSLTSTAGVTGRVSTATPVGLAASLSMGGVIAPSPVVPPGTVPQGASYGADAYGANPFAAAIGDVAPPVSTFTVDLGSSGATVTVSRGFLTPLIRSNTKSVQLTGRALTTAPGALAASSQLPTFTARLTGRAVGVVAGELSSNLQLTDEVAQQQAMEKAHVIWAFFVEMDFLSGIQRICNFNKTFTWSGVEWAGVGGLCSISEIKESEKIEPQPVTIGLNVAQQSWLALAVGAVEQYRGRPVRIWQCPLTSSFTLIGTPQLAWEGEMDVLAISAQDTSGSIAMRCEPTSKRLRRRNVIRINRAQHRQAHPADSGLDFQSGLLETPYTWVTRRYQQKTPPT